MSSLVQRQSERQGIFLVALSPFKRGAGGVKYQPYLSHPHPELTLRPLLSRVRWERDTVILRLSSLSSSGLTRGSR